jgi:hypothetical protein
VVDFDHGTGVEVWSSASWRDMAVSWLDDQLAAAGIKRTGEVEQPHLRPWATALKAPTDHGLVWLKAAGPGTAFEVGLYQLLQGVVPAHVLTPIAADVTRGWIVLPDGGPPLAERLEGSELVDALVIALPQYGHLQRCLTPHTEELLALGVADMRAAIMPQHFDEALEAVENYVDQRGEAADQTTLQRVAALHGDVASWCDQLAGAPGASSLDHNDLHPWNVLGIAEDGDGRARFYDWGDSVVAHPFASMLVALGYMQSHALKVRVDDPQILRLRDAYLDVFSDLAPRAELVEWLELACRVGKIARALTWNRAVRAFGLDEIDEEWARASLETLTSLLDESYLGGA